MQKLMETVIEIDEKISIHFVGNRQSYGLDVFSMRLYFVKSASCMHVSNQ